MFMFVFSELLYIHISKDNCKMFKDNEIRRVIFKNLLLGQNLINISVINEVANFVSNVEEDCLKEITYYDVIEEVGQIYDMSGNLV